MEVATYGKDRAEAIRDRNIDIIIAYCHSRKSCGKDELRCPVARICDRGRYRLITSFTDEEITEALQLIAAAGGFEDLDI